MRILDVQQSPPPRDAIDAAVHSLRGGYVIGIPTDTIYGLAADVSHTGAADRIFALKQRSRTFELPVLVSDIDQALSITTGVLPVAERLMEKFWPGSLTIVLPRHPDFQADLGIEDETVGVRCPDHLIPRTLCGEVGPLAVTSANLHGQPPLTEAQAVLDTFGEGVELVLDGGKCAGAASTVVDVTGAQPKILREGFVTWEDIQSVMD